MPTDKRRRLPTYLVTALALLLAGCSSTKADAPAEKPAKPEAAAQAPAKPAQDDALLDFIELKSASAADAQGPLPLVVAVHGLGDRPENLADIYRDIEVPCRIVLPRAPIPWHDGSSWFDVEIPYKPDAALGERIGEAADRVAQLMDHLARQGVRGKPVVTGFSQGGMISFAVAVRHPSSIAAAVALSGALPKELWPPAATGEGRVLPIVRALHGAMDDLVRVDYARQTVDALKRAGYDAGMTGYAGVAHSISPEMKRDALFEIEGVVRGAR